MRPRPVPLTFDRPSLPREWVIPTGKAVVGVALFLLLVVILTVGCARGVKILSGIVLSRDGTVNDVLKLVALAVLGPKVIVFSTEFAIACFASLFARPSHVWLTESEFWHPQLAAPVRLADVGKLVIRRGIRSPDLAVTLHTVRPVPIRFPSPFNLGRLITWRDASNRFTFLPMPWSNQGLLTQALADAVQAHGGEIVRS